VIEADQSPLPSSSVDNYFLLPSRVREVIGLQILRVLAIGTWLPAVFRARCWAALGCYREAITALEHRASTPWAFLIRALAACGARTEAERLARSLTSACRRRSAAQAVAAFHPALAASLLDGLPPSLLRAAVLSATGRRLAARTALSEAPRPLRSDPNIALLRANCGEIRPVEALNQCFSFFGLSQIAADGPSFPGNLRPEYKSAEVHGPLVSVIVPAHNTESLVGSALKSLLNQTWRNLEILAVDDASTDGTLVQLQHLSAQDSRVKILSHSRNLGPYAGRMTALSVARGDVVTCHDSDDWAHPQRIERQIEPLLRHRRLVATVSDWVRMAEDGTFYVRKSWPLIHHNPASVMFRRREVLGRMGGFDMVRAGADSEFYERLKVVFGAYAVRRTPGVLAVGSHRPHSLMNDPTIGVTDHILSPSRLSYWESWRRWHIECVRAGRAPSMPTDSSRPFDAPAEILLCAGAQRRCTL